MTAHLSYEAEPEGNNEVPYTPHLSYEAEPEGKNEVLSTN